MLVCLTLLLVAAAAVCVESTRSHGYAPHRIEKRQTTPCQADERFRRPDGRCNNLAHPERGSAGSIMPRILPNAYGNGANSPRTTGKSGNLLPGPRIISLNAHGPSDATSKVTLMLMQWGQFLDHDMSVVPHNEDPGCCVTEDPVCFNIPLPSDDEYFTGRDCMPLVRSVQTEVDGVGEQSNALTSYIDGSMVYGSSEEHMQDLRESSGGRLKFVSANGNHYLPEGADAECRNVTGEHCFEAGDARVNEQPGLAAIHTIFMREHNRIADGLRERNRDWSSDQIFEVARDIVASMIQHITYDQFLPLVLGPVFMERYGLKTSQPFNYDQEANPSISNEFATAAFRFGHSLIPEDITVNNEALMFKNLFFKPTPVLESFDELCAGLKDDKSMAMDRQFSHSITRHLIQDEERNGFDLVALNLQRGRDHGLQPLNEYRKICSGTPFTSLEQLFPGDSRAQAIYEDIDDVDLFTGGVAEAPVDDGLVGPTFACLLGTQFNWLRNGDRFFYLNRDRPQRFTREQVDEIKKVTLSKIVCENSENKRIQENIFLPESGRNRVRDCSLIPGLNLDRWRSGRRDGDDGGDGRRPRRDQP